MGESEHDRSGRDAAADEAGTTGPPAADEAAPAWPGGTGEPQRPTAEDRRRWTPPLPTDHPRHPDASPAAAAAWDGMVWGRLGRGDLAWACWDVVADEALLPWVAAERGRLLRELGLHAEARALEEAGLRAATDIVDVVMLRISLAADALGAAVGEVGTRIDLAGRQLEAAQAMLVELPAGPRTSRQHLRARWVAAEISLARGGRIDADGLPWRGDHRPGFPPVYDDGTDFHRAKGLLIAGVVRGDRWLLARAAELAPPALRWAVELARLDAGEELAADRAATAWRAIRPPDAHAAVVAASPVARRLRALA